MSKYPTVRANTLIVSVTAIVLVATSFASSLASECEVLELVPIDVDWGSSGTAHDQDWVGASLALATASRCSGDGSLCASNSDCDGSVCEPTCGTEPGDADLCEFTSSGGARACLRDSSVDCTTNVDCALGGDRCVRFVSPAAPFLVSGLPICVGAYLEDDATGTLSLGSGEAAVSVSMRWRLHLGIAEDQPCPRCGNGPGVLIGDLATCEGGPNSGAACVVEALSEFFGGVSSDCPPSPSANVSGLGTPMRLSGPTTDSTERTATLVCGAPYNQFHPSGGAAVCLDDFSACNSNSDCPSSTCGVYCHCGFCDQGSGLNPDLPCSGDADCGGGVCVSDPGDVSESQRRSNFCDSLVCGEVAPEQCCSFGEPGCASPTPLRGTCNEIPSSCVNDSDCVGSGRGTTCVYENRACFENTITRSGAPSAASGRCMDEVGQPPCATNADCGAGNCATVCPAPVLAAVGCVGGTASTAINVSTGSPGPIAMLFQGTMSTSGVCGDGTVNAGEQCDDGNDVGDDGCRNDCTGPVNAVCGNGVTEGDETCDDGNNVDGDCCSSSCTTDAPGTACSALCSQAGQCDASRVCQPISDVIDCDDNPCTTDQCLSGGQCASVAAPPIDCFSSAAARLDLRDRADDSLDVLRWRWGMGAPTTAVDLGTPDTNTDYTLCVYDFTGDQSQSVLRVDIDAGEQWTAVTPRTYRYDDPTGTARRMRLRARTGDRSHAKLLARGGGLVARGPISPLHYFNVDGLVTARLMNSEGRCWKTDFEPSTVLVNNGRRFHARIEPAP